MTLMPYPNNIQRPKKLKTHRRKNLGAHQSPGVNVFDMVASVMVLASAAVVQGVVIAVVAFLLFRTALIRRCWRRCTRPRRRAPREGHPPTRGSGAIECPSLCGCRGSRRAGHDGDSDTSRSSSTSESFDRGWPVIFPALPLEWDQGPTRFEYTRTRKRSGVLLAVVCLF